MILKTAGGGYLRGVPEKAHCEFHGWIKVLRNDLLIVDCAAPKFLQLCCLSVPDVPGVGFLEDIRIVQRIFKDKQKHDGRT